jgi:hypothetical protein
MLGHMGGLGLPGAVRVHVLLLPLSPLSLIVVMIISTTISHVYMSCSNIIMDT